MITHIWGNVVRVYFLTQRHAQIASEKEGYKTHRENIIYVKIIHYTHNTLEIKSGWKYNKMLAVSSLSAEIAGDFHFLLFCTFGDPKTYITCVINKLLQKREEILLGESESQCWKAWVSGYRRVWGGTHRWWRTWRPRLTGFRHQWR